MPERRLAENVSTEDLWKEINYTQNDINELCETMRSLDRRLKDISRKIYNRRKYVEHIQGILEQRSKNTND